MGYAAERAPERAPIEHPADLADPRERARLTAPALKAFFRLVAAWALREEDARALLGGMSHARFLSLRKAVETQATVRPLSQDELTRLSLLLGIARALRVLHAPPLADQWPALPNRNQMFAGRRPLDVMIRGGIPGLQQVRRLLDARRSLGA